MMRTYFLRVVLLMMTATTVWAGELWLPSIFSEKMVLQRQQPIPVWGASTAGATVTVTLFDGGTVLSRKAAVVAEGPWRVDLDPQEAGGRYSLLIESSGPAKGEGEMRLFTDVLIGEVWLICGQSNMIWPISVSAEKEDAEANRHRYPNLRIAMIGHRSPHEITEAQRDTVGYWGPVKWEDSSYTVPRSSRTDVPGSSSAVSYYFARQLYDHYEGKVPVGMLEVGAIMRVESWVDEATVLASPELRELHGKGYPLATSRSYKANIAPLAPFGIRGAIYYQGEMNAGAARSYYYGLTALIASWRQSWHAPELPFLIVQLPSFIRHEADEKHELDMDAASLAAFDANSASHGYCFVREAQRQVQAAVPHTAMVTTIDLGEPFDIHPPRKQPVGERLFLQARSLVYGDTTSIAQGPAATAFKLAGDTCTVSFEHVAEGLELRESPVGSGFEVRDTAGAWLPATARIVGTTVEVKAPAGTTIDAVRYAWRGYPPITLWNRAGLPASPFIHPPIDFATLKQ